MTFPDEDTRSGPEPTGLGLNRRSIAGVLHLVRWRGYDACHLPGRHTRRPEYVRRDRMHYLRRSSAVLALALIILSACQTGGSTTPSASASGSGGGGGSKGTIKIGIDLPLSGGETTNGEPTANGVKLALKDAGGVAGGYTVELDIRDDAVNGVHNPDQGATNVQALVADDAVI